MPARPETDNEYAALLACFRSEQMSAADIHARMSEDPGFRDYVETAVAGHLPRPAADQAA